MWRGRWARSVLGWVARPPLSQDLFVTRAVPAAASFVPSSFRAQSAPAPHRQRHNDDLELRGAGVGCAEASVGACGRL